MHLVLSDVDGFAINFHLPCSSLGILEDPPICSSYLLSPMLSADSSYGGKKTRKNHVYWIYKLIVPVQDLTGRNPGQTGSTSDCFATPVACSSGYLHHWKGPRRLTTGRLPAFPVEVRLCRESSISSENWRSRLVIRGV